MELIYGTGNQAKLSAMQRTLEGLPVTIISLKQAVEREKILLPEIDENGATPLENARIKAHIYYKHFKKPVFSCDSGLYLWKAKTGEMLPEELQPGIHVRGRGEKRLTDEELILHYTGLAKEYGPVLARYKNGICLVADKEHVFECMDESLWGQAFLLADTPHPRRIPGFPLDSISIEISSNRYYYDLSGNSQDVVACQAGFRQFFERYMKMADLRDA